MGRLRPHTFVTHWKQTMRSMKLKLQQHLRFEVQHLKATSATSLRDARGCGGKICSAFTSRITFRRRPVLPFRLRHLRIVQAAPLPVRNPSSRAHVQVAVSCKFDQPCLDGRSCVVTGDTILPMSHEGSSTCTFVIRNRYLLYGVVLGLGLQMRRGIVLLWILG
jgi:hypothetical protein